MKLPEVPLHWRVTGLIASGLICVGCLAGNSPIGAVGSGLLYATLFQHAMLAASWVSLGPGTFSSRLGLSFGWLVLLIGAAAVPLLHDPEERGPEALCALALALWLVGQIPGWLLAWSLRVRIEIPGASRNKTQFHLRHLMLLMVVVCVITALSREALGWRLLAGANLRVLGILSASHVIIQFSLGFCLLRRRHVMISLLVGALLIAAGTFIEVESLDRAAPREGNLLFYWMYGFAALWACLFAWALRSGGYQVESELFKAKYHA
ncbi:hypothetical protein [Anatilimnocola floriformis]|uniref:hypothetical protein n=1 Tax=Anatilimnocola floriformis TaxID=2948575 RepID=UPI0020C3274E|nr:hypothetical protein [Anatilimnocola floriformis]